MIQEIFELQCSVTGGVVETYGLSGTAVESLFHYKYRKMTVNEMKNILLAQFTGP
jgi:hypothetical protein